MTEPFDADALDAMSVADFETAVAPLFEGAHRFLTRLAGTRPHGSMETFFGHAREIVHEMPDAEQVELIDAHPRLGAPPASLSSLSYVEQGYDRGGPGAAIEAERIRVAEELERLNDSYEARFGFRYCTFVAGRSRAALLDEIELALERDRDSELHRALDAVIDIAKDRHAKLIRAAEARAAPLEDPA